MRDRFTEAELELQDKSPFVCASCGHPQDISKTQQKTTTATGSGVHDRFTEAVMEEAEKSAFVCESCGHKQKTQGKTKH